MDNLKHIDSKVTVIHTVCEVCMNACGIDAYVKNGKIIHIEGTKDDPVSKGYVCTKGQANIDYIYRKDRIRTPLKRVGARGEGKFEEISWQEAYSIIADKLNQYKKESGANSVIFASGYTKWYRNIYYRFIRAFGSKNFCTDDSNCHYSAVMANRINSGCDSHPDLANSGLFLGWAFNRYNSGCATTCSELEKRKKQGLKIIIIDPKSTEATQKLADLHLRPYPGTDGALALGMANLLIQWDKIDHAYIREHVYGFEKYREYVSHFTPETVEKITSVPAALLEDAVRMMTNHGPICINESSAPISHHTNGFQSYRAIMSLAAITGNFDRIGGQIPNTYHVLPDDSFEWIDEDFGNELPEIDHREMIGESNYPLWADMMKQGQAMQMAKQILTQKPYPLRAMFALGLNYRMYPNNESLKKAIEQLDFFCDVDLFLTDTAKLADIVLPACSGFERSTLHNYNNGRVFFTKPAIPALYSAKSDVDILTDLAKELNLNDPVLKSGYKACCSYMLKKSGINIDTLIDAEKSMILPRFQKYIPGTNTKTGYSTPTGKYELYSKQIESYHLPGLNPLPEWEPEVMTNNRKDYPLLLITGTRLPFAMHSRLHEVSWLRTFRKYPSVELHPADANEYNITQGDSVTITTEQGSISFNAILTYTQKPGVVTVYHGYKEADINSIIPEYYDRYTGFPNLRCIACKIEKNLI